MAKCGNCENCQCESNESLLDALSFTLADLGVESLEGVTDRELIELADRKIRMLHRMCITAGVDEEFLRDAMCG